MAQLKTMIRLDDLTLDQEVGAALGTLFSGITDQVKATILPAAGFGGAPKAVGRFTYGRKVATMDVATDDALYYAEYELTVEVPYAYVLSGLATAFQSAVGSLVMDRLDLALGASPLGTNEHQTVLVVADGGTFPLTFEGQTVTGIAWNATAAAIKTALATLSNLDAAEIVTTGGPVNSVAVNIEFKGRWAGHNVDLMTSSTASLTGSGKAVTVGTPVAGISAGTPTFGQERVYVS